MAIASFPTQLVPLIQQGFLAREFENGLQPRLGYRAVADRMVFPNQIGQTITMTRKGLKTPVVTALTPSGNTNFDNGLTPSAWSIEQFTLAIAMYGDTIDLNMVTEQVGIESQFLANAYTNGVQAAQSLDRLARNALFGGVGGDVGGYLGGNTRTRTTLGSPATTISVDDIRGFQNVLSTLGVVTPVSSGAPMAVTVGADIYQLVGSSADGTNVSTAPNGISGTLTFSTNVTVSDSTALNAVIAATAPLVFRPNARATTAALIAPQGVYGAQNYVPGDTLTMNTVLSGVAALRANSVPSINGAYNCYIDDMQLLGLFRDSDFKLLYRGDYGSDAYTTGNIEKLLGVRFITTTESPQQASLGAGAIHRALMLGQGALIEGDFAGMGKMDIPDMENSVLEMINGICQITRAPLDRLRQIIAQSWYWIGGFSLPTDLTANTNIVATASNSYLKRGVMLESL